MIVSASVNFSFALFHSFNETFFFFALKYFYQKAIKPCAIQSVFLRLNTKCPYTKDAVLLINNMFIIFQNRPKSNIWC